MMLGARTGLAGRAVALAGMLIAGTAAADAARADALGLRWVEQEAGFNGVWTRRGQSDVFDAVWAHPSGPRDQAVLRITISGNRVQVIRTQAQGNCVYQGIIGANQATVAGTFSCSWAPRQTVAWSATIVGAGAGPTGTSGFGLWAYRSNIALPWSDPCNIQYVLAARGDRYETLVAYRLVRSVPKRQAAELLHRKFSAFYHDHADGVVKMRPCRQAQRLPFDDPDGGTSTTHQRHGGPLGTVWYERESGHAGTWRRRGNSNVFDGSWSEGTRATLTISLSGNSVRIVRQQPQGTCNYAGTIADDRRTVHGRYRCPWMSKDLEWSATIN